MTRKAWQITSWSLLAFWLSCAVLEVTSAGPYALRAWGADLTVPAWMYIQLRSLEGPRRRQVFHRLMGRTPEQAAILLFAASTATELLQKFWPRGPFPGSFDPYDIVAFAVGIAACYTMDRRTIARGLHTSDGTPPRLA
jgi:hypothetical protein